MTEIIEDVRDRTTSKIDLVRKLLAKAESTDSESERDALNERASQLVAAYGIDEAMLASQDESLDKITDVSAVIERPFARDFRDLLASIAQPLRVKVIYSKRWNADQNDGEGGWDVTARLSGYDSDIRRVQLLYPHLRNQALAGLAKVQGDEFTEYGLGAGQAANKRAYMRASIAPSITAWPGRKGMRRPQRRPGKTPCATKPSWAPPSPPPRASSWCSPTGRPRWRWRSRRHTPSWGRLRRATCPARAVPRAGATARRPAWERARP